MGNLWRQKSRQVEKWKMRTWRDNSISSKLKTRPKGDWNQYHIQQGQWINQSSFEEERLNICHCFLFLPPKEFINLHLRPACFSQLSFKNEWWTCSFIIKAKTIAVTKFPFSLTHILYLYFQHKFYNQSSKDPMFYITQMITYNFTQNLKNVYVFNLPVSEMVHR